MQLSCTTSYGFLAPCQNLEQVNDTVQRKCPNRWMEGWTEGWKDRRKDGRRTEGWRDPIL